MYPYRIEALTSRFTPYYEERCRLVEDICESSIITWTLVILDTDELDPFLLQVQGKGGRHGKTINIFSIASGHL